jgi:hypothetical protein
MKFIKRFNEDLETKEVTKKHEKCIELSKNCIDACNVAMDDFKDANNLEAVIVCNECIYTCELYIHCCEYETKNLDAVADITKSILTELSEVKPESELETACLSLLKEIENCIESRK